LARSNSITPIFVSCNRDCGGGCALTAEVEDGRVTRVRDSDRRPEFMRGCVKGYRSAETVYHPDRITEPLIRTGSRGSGEFRTASWGEALDLVAGKLARLGSEGRWGEVLKLGGSGSCRGALHNTALTTARFLALWGGYTDTTGGYSSHASDYVKGPMFGTRFVGVDARTLLHSDHIILWGFNPFDTRFGSETEEVLKEAVRRGIAVTVVDPRKARSGDPNWTRIGSR
jgi:anaerobic dimethyl sulfoxide reductase subunit A